MNMVLMSWHMIELRLLLALLEGLATPVCLQVLPNFLQTLVQDRVYPIIMFEGWYMLQDLLHDVCREHQLIVRYELPNFPNQMKNVFSDLTSLLYENCRVSMLFPCLRVEQLVQNGCEVTPTIGFSTIHGDTIILMITRWASWYKKEGVYV